MREWLEGCDMVLFGVLCWEIPSGLGMGMDPAQVESFCWSAASAAILV